jgi:hypothetical protein
VLWKEHTFQATIRDVIRFCGSSAAGYSSPQPPQNKNLHNIRRFDLAALKRSYVLPRYSFSTLQTTAQSKADVVSASITIGLDITNGVTNEQVVTFPSFYGDANEYRVAIKRCNNTCR